MGVKLLPRQLLFCAILSIGSAEATGKTSPSEALPLADVRVFGAKGDGQTDDSSAIFRAIESLPSSGGVLFFPKGEYVIRRSIAVNLKDRLTFRGAGMSDSVIKNTVAGAVLFECAGTIVSKQVQFEDLGFHLNPGSAIILSGKQVKGPFRVYRCQFWNAHGITISSMNDVAIEQNFFSSSGKPNFTYIRVRGTSRDIILRQNRFLYFRNAIQIEDNAKNVMVRDNYFDGAWWLLAEDFAGEGSTVRYDGTSLTDEAGQFEGLSPYVTVRAMPVLRRGTADYTDSNLTDSSADFTKSKIQRGQIVRVAAAFAVISRVNSPTSLSVEQWLGDKERHGMPVPAGPYTIYGTYLGTVLAVTGNRHSLTVRRWLDLNGNTVVPANGTRYELCKQKPNYPFASSNASSNVTVQDNTFRRGWADQISIGGSGSTVSNNTVEDGQDMGITIERGHHNTISNNRVTHQGANNIVVFRGHHNTVTSNTCSDAMWISTYLPTAANIVVDGGIRNRIENNHVERLHLTNNLHGVVIYSQADSRAADNIVAENVGINLPATAFVARGPHTLRTVFNHNTGSTATDEAAPPSPTPGRR